MIWKTKKGRPPNEKTKNCCFTIRCFDMTPMFSSLSLLHLFAFLSYLSASNEDEEDNRLIPIYNTEILWNVSNWSSIQIEFEINDEKDRRAKRKGRKLALHNSVFWHEPAIFFAPISSTTLAGSKKLFTAVTKTLACKLLCLPLPDASTLV